MRALGCKRLLRAEGLRTAQSKGEVRSTPYTELAPALGSGLGEAVYFLDGVGTTGTLCSGGPRPVRVSVHRPSMRVGQGSS